MQSGSEWRARTAWSPTAVAALQAAAVGAIVALTIGIGMAGQQPLAKAFYIAAGLTAAAGCLRLSPWLYLTWAFWFWTLTPFVRRVLDEYGSFDPTDPILGLPNVMSLLTLVTIFGSRILPRLREALPGIVLLFAVGYGAALNLVAGNVLQGLIGAADWVVPLLYFFFLLALADRIEEFEPHFKAFLSINLPVLVGYALWQFVDPPTWDALWIRNANLPEFGPARPQQIRVFGTLNAPVPMAVWLGTALLLALRFRNWVITAALPFAAIALTLTLTRSVLGCTLLGFVACLLLSQTRTAATTLRNLVAVLGTTAVIGGIVLANDPTTSERIIARIETIGQLGSDVSGAERQVLYELAPMVIDQVPMGRGIGSVGRGATLGDSDFVIIDGAPVAIYIALGWVVGTVFFLGLAGTLSEALRAALRTANPTALVLTAAAFANLANLAFSSLTGFYAVVTWFCLGYACAIGAHARLNSLPHPAPLVAPTALGGSR